MKEKKVIQLSRTRSILVLILIIMFLQMVFVGIVMLGHRYVLPIEEEDLPILLSALTGLIASAIGGGVIIYISHLQQEAQNQFFLEHEANEKKRLFLQLYFQKVDEFVSSQKKWIRTSDFLIKKEEELVEKEKKWYFREVWDSLVLIYRFHHIFLDKDIEMLWAKLELLLKSFEAWLQEKMPFIDKGEKKVKLGEEYYRKYYLPFQMILNDLTSFMMEEQKKKILELKG